MSSETKSAAVEASTIAGATGVAAGNTAVSGGGPISGRSAAMASHATDTPRKVTATKPNMKAGPIPGRESKSPSASDAAGLVTSEPEKVSCAGLRQNVAGGSAGSRQVQ